MSSRFAPRPTGILPVETKRERGLPGFDNRTEQGTWKGDQRFLLRRPLNAKIGFMKSEEETAERYLAALGLGAVTYEPDGGIPPDFSGGPTIAVEVRRLNQNYFGETDVKGLEQVSIPIEKALAETLATFEAEPSEPSYWVFLHFARPLLN